VFTWHIDAECLLLTVRWCGAAACLMCVVLFQERVEGDTIATLCRKAREASKGDATVLEAALAGPRAAFREVLDTLGKMIFVDGFFHADPHPGNVMVRTHPTAPPRNTHTLKAVIIKGGSTVLRGSTVRSHVSRLCLARGAQVDRSSGLPVLIDWGQCMELSNAQRRTLCEMTLLLRTRCMPLIGSVLSSQGFGFSTGAEGEMAALIYFFFDSAVKVRGAPHLLLERQPSGAWTRLVNGAC